MALVRKILLLHFGVRDGVFQIESNNRALLKKKKLNKKESLSESAPSSGHMFWFPHVL